MFSVGANSNSEKIYKKMVNELMDKNYLHILKNMLIGKVLKDEILNSVI